MTITAAPITSTKDNLSRFLFDNHAVRGEIVTLSKTFQDILASHNYPIAVQNLLGELLTATSLLTATLKFDGDICVQLQGDGPLALAVINGNQQQEMRGVARVKGEIRDNATLHEMVGKGFLVITITPKKGERYQGIVGLEFDTITACLEDYFMRSEQLPTRLFIRTGTHNNQAMAAGILLQVLPASDRNDSDFEHLAVLAHTIKAEELFSLSAEEVLYRLYNQEETRLFDPQPVSFKCTCSRERTEESLTTVSDAEIDIILAEDGKIEMHCDYCGTNYIFDAIDVEIMRKKKAEYEN